MTSSQRDGIPLYWSIRSENDGNVLYQQAVSAALDYLDTVNERRVYPDEAALARLAGLDEALPDHATDGSAVLHMLHELGSPATVAQGGGRYFGFVNGGVFPTALAARWLADAWDQNAALHVMSPVASKLEQIVERWLVELFDLPDGTAAGFVTGSATATLIGLLAGRNTLLARLGWDVAELGLSGAPALRVVMSEQAHATVSKALAILGIGRKSIHWVPADNQGRIDVAQMPPLDDRTLLVLQAGNVNSGAFDAFEAACQMARHADAWVHVDGAFGLWAAASDQTRHLTNGVALADSWSVDAHKTLNAPYDSGVVLCRDREALLGALQTSGAYLHYGNDRDGMRYTLEMSRRARGIELWALLKSLGREGVAALVEALHSNARLFEALLTRHDFRILNDVVFNQVLVACETPAITEAALRHIQDSGECWCGGSIWQGEPVIRISVCSWATTPDDVQRSVQAFVAARTQARQELA